MEPHERDTQDCLAIEDGKTALNCLKKVVEQYSDSDVCRPKLVLLVQKGCDSCKEEIAKLADDIAKGIIQKINVASPEGMAIAEKNDIEIVPSLILLDCHENIIMPV